MGSKFVTIALAVIGAGMLADVLAHPTGSSQIGTAFTAASKRPLQAVTGQAIT